MSNATLRNQIHSALLDLDKLQEALMDEARMMSIPVTVMKDSNGTLVLIPVIVAKAHLLSALAYLEKP